MAKGTPPLGVMISQGLRPVPDPDAPQEPDADDKGGQPDQDADNVRPEWVDYHTEDENCKGCEYMDPSGNCQVLNMQVGPEDHCNAFTAKQASAQPGQEASPEDSAAESTAQ